MGAPATIMQAGLTEQQRLFVAAFLETANAADAARVAEYSGNHKIAGWQTLREPKIVAAIQAAVSLRLRTEGATVAHSVLLEIARDKDAAKGVRVDAAKALLDRAGFVAPRATEAKSQEGRPLSDYSIEELRGLVSQLERARGDQAKDVSSVVSAPIAAQLTEMME